MLIAPHLNKTPDQTPIATSKDLSFEGLLGNTTLMPSPWKCSSIPSLKQGDIYSTLQLLFHTSPEQRSQSASEAAPCPPHHSSGNPANCLLMKEEWISAVQTHTHTHTHTKKYKQNSNDHSYWQGREKGPGEWLLYHSVWSQCLFLTLVKPSPLWPIPFDLLWDVHELQVRKGDSGCSFSCYRAFVPATMACVLPAGPLSDRNHPVLPAGLLMPTAGTHCPTPMHAQHGSQAPPRCPVRMWWTNCALEESEISLKREQVCAPALSPVSPDFLSKTCPAPSRTCRVTLGKFCTSSESLSSGQFPGTLPQSMGGGV